MKFGEKIVVFIFRPIYRTLFERLFWWFMAKVKAFMLADIVVRLNAIERRLETGGAERQELLTAIQQEHRRAEGTTAAQWDAIEQLLLALFRQPIPGDPGFGRSKQDGSLDATGNDLNGVHEGRIIR